MTKRMDYNKKFHDEENSSIHIDLHSICYLAHEGTRRTTMMIGVE
jgi:hypothetical protein